MTTRETTRRRVFQAVEDRREELLSFASALVKERSVQGDEAGSQAIVRDAFETMSLDVSVLTASDVDGIESHPEYDPAGEPYDDRPNIIGVREGRGDGRSLKFNGHVDVVPEGDVEHWSFDPYAGDVVDGQLRGRGAADMKTGVAAMTFAVAALQDADVELAGDVVLESVIEEEAGGYGGTLATVLDGPRADAVVIPEPTDFDMWIANDGVSYFRVTVAGKSAHAAETDAGVNAISKIFPIYEALIDLHDERKTTVHDDLFEQWHEHTVSLNPGTLHAGAWPSSVPDEAVLEGRVSHAPSETRGEIRKTVESVVYEAVADDPWFDDHPPEVEWFGWKGSSAKISPDEPIVTTVRDVMADAFDSDSTPKGFPGGIDTRFFVNYADTPAICFGLSANNIHGSDEYADVDEIVTLTKALAAIAMAWCGVADD